MHLPEPLLKLPKIGISEARNTKVCKMQTQDIFFDTKKFTLFAQEDLEKKVNLGSRSTSDGPNHVFCKAELLFHYVTNVQLWEFLLLTHSLFEMPFV